MIIKELRDATKSSGGKASGLAFLIQNDFPVPKGFVIEDSFGLNFNDAEIEQIKKILSSMDLNKKLAVRSSASAEDGAEKSFAGVFETVLNVENNIKSVINAIEKVNESASTGVVKAYSCSEKQTMNIVIQEMVDPKISGVLFTEAIDINGDNTVLFECVEGLADKLVSGASTPAQVIMKVDNNRIDNSNFRVEGSLIDIHDLVSLIPYVNKLKQICDRPLDVEWCVDKSGQVYFVQARPITSTVFINRSNDNTGIIASRGYAEGETYVIDEKQSDEEIQKAIDNFKDNSILVAGITETLYMPAIKKAKGIITEEGSSLSHAAIVSRELGIPCIAGYKNAINLFPTGTFVVLDALNGMVKANGVETTTKNTKGFEFGELYCFDNSYIVNFDNFSAVFELTLEGLMVHMQSEDSSPMNMEILEKYSRSFFKTSPEQHFDDKYLWYFEIERFKLLPFYKEMNDEMLSIVKNKNPEEVDDFYKKLLSILKDLMSFYDKSASNKEKILIGEMGAAINLILDAMLPIGYALRQCYMDSIQLLDKYDLSFNDLLVNHSLKTNDEKLENIKRFLFVVSINRNEIYEKICSIGATSPQYFRMRDKTIKELCNYNDVNDFYAHIKEEDLYNIELIMKPYFKKNNQLLYLKNN